MGDRCDACSYCNYLQKANAESYRHGDKQYEAKIHRHFRQFGVKLLLKPFVFFHKTASSQNPSQPPSQPPPSPNPLPSLQPLSLQLLSEELSLQSESVLLHDEFCKSD